MPHETPERATHGGSYFEASEWWRTPRHVSLAGEWKFMIPEILLLRGLREYNRPLWFRSFPFHFGLYLLAGTTGLVCVTAAAIVVGAAATAGCARGHRALGFLGDRRRRDCCSSSAVRSGCCTGGSRTPR